MLDAFIELLTGWYPGLVNVAFLLGANIEDLDKAQAALYNLDDHRSTDFS